MDAFKKKKADRKKKKNKYKTKYLVAITSGCPVWQL